VGSERGQQSVAPLVSVIIPAYQAAAFIGDALDSVFRQSYRNFEVIVVDDGSPDGDELERAVAMYRQRIVYLRQENAGPSSARNAAIRQAKGEYLAFLDSDDVWRPECLASQIALALASQPARDLVYSDMLVSNELMPGSPSKFNGRRYTEVCPSNGPVSFQSLVLEDCQAPTSCTMVRREIAIAAGLFDESIRRAEDYDLWLRIAHRTTRMARQQKVLGRLRARPGSLSSDGRKMGEGTVEVLKKLRATLDLSVSDRAALQRKLDSIEAQLELELGKAELLAGHYALALASLSRASTILVNNRRLSWAIIGLKFAPRLTHTLARKFLRTDA
jgi:glycosyltransferase involved in cell wall biosynthesis